MEFDAGTIAAAEQVLGVEYTPQRPQRWNDAAPEAQPGSDAAIAFAPVAHLSRWIRDGALSSERRTEIYLDRIGRHGPRLECHVTVLPERARAEALHGRAAGGRHSPRAVARYPLCAEGSVRRAGRGDHLGRRALGQRVAETDSVVVERLRAADAVLIGKASVAVLAFGDI
jgi:Asp-tRNA(Asn)/Glu-tRNA(Gln) amidotransferase A subunit family amidase